ncbi:DUF2637 domain-containing protein [Solwaraspora sp. WMMD406]|uniref:DUF2637 domain-containing protein n=1 Tax=Solwaraspora sp. WMMD406 TaxID=3016095 RepID=UPI0024171744|nr:DUF2637 domain-containing protein [Solwaraspora sp. WMMD406]MDG4768517.1 DUF2637 domain-containing protein [Solwaraspora sp. WMMD406]
MTAPPSVYPPAVSDLMPAARDLTARLGTLPSQNRIKTELRVGHRKAGVILDSLRADFAPPAADPAPPAVDTTPGEPGPDPDTTPDVGITPAPLVPAVDTPPPLLPLPTVAVEPVPEITPTTATMPADGGPRRRRPAPGRVWAYVGVTLGGLVSIAANVAHTYLPKPPPGVPDGWTAPADWSPSPLAIAISVFWPIALFVAVEILTRITWGDGFWWFLARVVGVLPVALVAAVVSYRHLSGLLAHFGEDPLTVAIGPLAVDGLMVMASAALMVTSRKRTTDA